MGQFKSRTGRWRQALAWLALVAVVSFVVLDAVHSHNDLAGSHSRCELCLTLHAPALRSVAVTLPFSVSTRPVATIAAPVLLNRVPLADLFIRPPPAA